MIIDKSKIFSDKFVIIDKFLIDKFINKFIIIDKMFLDENVEDKCK